MFNLGSFKSQSRLLRVHLVNAMARKHLVLVFYKGAVNLYSLFQNSLQRLKNLLMG